jgi:DUF4097 and DUF4098 domain-containing protein YvlB
LDVLKEAAMNRKNLTLFLAGLFVCVFAFASAVTETINKEFPFPKDGKLTIENVNGKIIVEQWDKDSVKIEAVKTAKGSSDENARKALTDAKVEFTVEGKNTTVSVKTPQSFSFFTWLCGMGSTVEISFKIMAPSSAKLDLTSVNGDISVTVKDARVEAETVNGAVTVKNAAILSATTVNGSIDFDTENIAQIESVNGAITGAIRSEKPKPGSVEVVNGSISVKLLPSAGVTLSAESINGGIESDFAEVEGTKREKSGDVGGGGDKISLETVNGSIEVRKL